MNMTVRDALRGDALIAEAQLTWKMSALRVRSATHMAKDCPEKLISESIKQGLHHFEWDYVK